MHDWVLCCSRCPSIFTSNTHRGPLQSICTFAILSAIAYDTKIYYIYNKFPPLLTPYDISTSWFIIYVSFVAKYMFICCLHIQPFYLCTHMRKSQFNTELYDVIFNFGLFFNFHQNRSAGAGSLEEIDGTPRLSKRHYPVFNIIV